jgi:hypothetical protein
MTIEFVMKTWACKADHCTSKCDGVGNTPIGLTILGWHVEKLESGDIMLLCPIHHPDGAEGALTQAQEIKTILHERINEESGDERNPHV